MLQPNTLQLGRLPHQSDILVEVPFFEHQQIMLHSILQASIDILTVNCGLHQRSDLL